MAELVDAADLKSADRKIVQVQVLSRAPCNFVQFDMDYNWLAETLVAAALDGDPWAIQEIARAIDE